ncbi:uncharacterized protein [Garra rufa]|uniref:uncharacterized protein n=1 Tax=Garra rufa TaxID=137080 RepID=UPI003CCEB0A9
MDPLCSIIVVLLLTAGAFSSALEDKELNVHLEPTYIKVCEGASVTINCTFQPSGNYKVQWLYSQTPILDGRSAYKIPEGQHFFKVINKDWSTLNINFIKTNESGWYFCEVIQDIPILIKTCSNGTQVIVDATSISTSTTATVSQNETENLTTDSPTSCMNNATTIPTTISPPLSSFDQWWIWLALAVGCVVLVVSIVCIFILTRKQEDIIYENTKPVESSCWRQNRTKKDICDLAASKKTDTIKPLRKYDTLSSNRIRRP